MMRQVKILFLNDNPLPARFTTHTIQAKELHLRTALPWVSQIDCITPISRHLFRSNKPSAPKIKLHRLLPFPYYLRSIPLFFQGFIYCLQSKPDLIEAESPIISGISAILLGKIFHLPTVVEYRASYDELLKLKVTWLPLKLKQRILNFLCREILSKTSLVISNSRYYQIQLRHLYNVDSIAINPGLQNLPSKITPFNSHPSTFIIGFLGRLVPEKGVHVLIQAFKILQTKTTSIPVKLIITGDGPQKKQLISLVDQLKLTPLVKFTGWQPNYSALKKFHLLVNPNLVHHPLEMVNLEAASMGLPVISFGRPGCPETVIDRQTGILIASQKPGPLAAAIFSLIHNPSLRWIYRQNSRKLAKKYSFKSQVNLLAQAYRLIGLP